MTAEEHCMIHIPTETSSLTINVRRKPCIGQKHTRYIL